MLYACVGMRQQQPAVSLVPVGQGIKKPIINEQLIAADVSKSVHPFTANGDWMISKMALSESHRRLLLTLTAQHAVWCEDTTKFIARYGDCIATDGDMEGVESSHSDSKIRKTEAALEERLRALLHDMEVIVDGVLGPKSSCGQFLSKRFKDCPAPWGATTESPELHSRPDFDPQRETRPTSPLSISPRSRSDSIASSKKTEKLMKRSDSTHKRGSGINLIPPVAVPNPVAAAVIVTPVQPQFQLFIDPTFASLPWEGLPLIDGCSGGTTV